MPECAARDMVSITAPKRSVLPIKAQLVATSGPGTNWRRPRQYECVEFTGHRPPVLTYS